MPAILVEVGFLSNPTEASRLASAEHQQALARAIASGIEAFLNES
jgi:N-acetylmuramoyl-L-alanine amidase